MPAASLALWRRWDTASAAGRGLLHRARPVRWPACAPAGRREIRHGVDLPTNVCFALHYQPALPDSARRHYSNNFGLLMATVEKQDFPVSNGFYSGTQDDIVFGRKGPAQQRRSRSHP